MFRFSKQQCRLQNNTSSVNNLTNDTWSESDWIKYFKFVRRFLEALKILYILISILVIMGNTLFLQATWKERSLHQPNKYFIACLAFADLLVGLFVGPLTVYQLYIDYESGRALSVYVCCFIVRIDCSAFRASICTLMLISVDRYIKTSKPLHYRSRMTSSKSLKIIFIIWLI